MRAAAAGKRLVLAGAGLHHKDLVDLAAPMLSGARLGSMGLR
jgi:hypothetical protein